MCAWRLHTELAGYDGLEWLVALGLMILNRGSAERRCLATDPAGTKFARVRVCVLVIVLVVTSGCR